MKQLILILIAILIGLNGYAQDVESKYDLKLGIGTSLLGTGDMQTIMFENEINFKLNKYFTLGEGLSFAKSGFSVLEQASFIQLNSNIYISPFKNNRQNDFRFGAGLSWYSISDFYQSSTVYIDEGLLDSEYEFSKRNSLGLNIIIENTYSISEKFLVGLKFFTQPYKNGDINSGLLLKVGLEI